MPVAYVKKLAHKHGTSVSTAERRWKRAKASAAKQGHGEDYGYITGIFKNMMSEGIDEADEADESTKKYHEDVRLRQRQARKIYKDMEAKGKVNKKEFVDHLIKELGMKPDQADFWYWDIAEPKIRNASVSSKEEHRAPAKHVKADEDEPEEMTAEDAPSFKEFLIMEKDIVKSLINKAKKTKYNFKTTPIKEAEEGQLFVVFYQVVGERVNGTYLVNATDKSHARRIIRKIDPDYARITAMTTSEAAKEFSEKEDEFLKGIKKPAFGKFTHIESGT